jgi:hypothetical protein
VSIENIITHIKIYAHIETFKASICDPVLRKECESKLEDKLSYIINLIKMAQIDAVVTELKSAIGTVESTKKIHVKETLNGN